MPTPKSYEWALGLASKETTFATAQADGSLTDRLAVTGPDFVDLAVTYRTDQDEINGFVGASEHQEESRAATLARKMQGSVESIAWGLVMLFGNITASSGTTPNYTHTLKWRGVCTINPPSFTFVEGLVCSGATGTYWLYKGSVVDSLSVEVNGKGFVQFSITVKTDGSETAKTSFSWPATPNAVNKLIGSMLTLLCGSAGTENLTSIVRSFKLTANANIVEPPNIAGVTVSEYQYGGSAPTLDVEFTVRGDKSHALYIAYQNKTNQILDALLQYDANRSIRLHCTKGIVNATVKPSGNETQLTVKYMAEHNSTDVGAGVFTLKTGTATYLNAA
jgi:hypothetical protein